MKASYFLLTVLLSTSIYCGGLSKDNLDNLRILLIAAAERESALDSLDIFIDKIDDNISQPGMPLILAYKGAAKAIRAKYNFWPWDKLSNVNAGLELLNNSVDSDKYNLEIRFLRFAVLHNLPSFLGRSQEADSEAEVLYKMITNTNSIDDQFLVKKIAGYLVESNRLTNNRAKQLKSKFGIT